MGAVVLHEAGPLLSGLLKAQRREEQLVQYPGIEQLAAELVAAVEAIEGCLLWPVGSAAERLAGAATLHSRGAVDVAASNTPVAGRQVVLVGLVAVSPIVFEAVGEVLRRRGATAVHACAVDVVGLDRAAALDSHRTLRAGTDPSALSLVGDAA
jgi:hypothetical protein